jgi:hypothetical protein
LRAHALADDAIKEGCVDAVTRTHRSVWSIRYQEARRQALLAAIILWITAALMAFLGSGMRSVMGPLKGTDFVQFYTLGYQARTGQFRAYDADKQYRTQTALVPESAPDVYVPVYPPHVALVFVPFSAFSYGTAALLWAVVNVVGYGVIVWITWRTMGRAFRDWRFIVAAAAAFPPFWNLILHGQTTLIPLSALCGGWLALVRRKPALAGFVFGFLAVKPQLGLVLAVVVLAAREWRMCMGIFCSIALQIIAIVVPFGTSMFRDYVHVVSQFPSLAPHLDPKPFQVHSLIALTRLIPHGGLVWGLLSAVIAWRTVTVWRSSAPLSIRMSAFVIATVLVSPHLLVYDATVLVLPFLWIGSEVASNERLKRHGQRFGSMVYWLYVTLLIPTALFIHLQASVIILACLFWYVSVMWNESSGQTPLIAGSWIPIANRCVSHPLAKS